MNASATPYQRRKAKKEADAKAERRQELVKTLLMLVYFAICFAAYIIGNIIAFGGGIEPGSVWAKLMAWLS